MQGKFVLLWGMAASLFALIVVGAYVAAADFGEACGSNIPSDWPLCLGNLFPPPQLGPVVEYTHRLLAVLSSLLLFLTTYLFWRQKQWPVNRILLVASLLLVFQVVLGGVVVAQGLESALVALHQAAAILIFGLAVAAVSVSWRKQ